MADYSKEELWELYEQLPEDLKKATFSEEVGQTIQNICDKNGVAGEDLIFNITKNVGYVFLGLLSPDEFIDALEKELKIEKDKAESINSQITTAIFIPLKNSLEKLYGIKIEIEKTTPIEEETPEPEKDDSYREPIK
ncbi:MAG: hypothetical protein Q8N58_02860 [bacterium]|nr:hypothetical protein [bacterium]